MTNVDDVEEAFGLVAKRQAAQEGNFRLLNFKVKVSIDFHSRWMKALKQLSKLYSGGGAALVLKALEELLPKLEALVANGTASAKPDARKAGGAA